MEDADMNDPGSLAAFFGAPALAGGAPHPAIQNLINCQRQLDADGCEVGVSRQALDETLGIVADLRDVLSQLVAAHDEYLTCNDGFMGNQADAYYRLAKIFDQWNAARAALSRATATPPEGEG